MIALVTETGGRAVGRNDADAVFFACHICTGMRDAVETISLGVMPAFVTETDGTDGGCRDALAMATA